LLLYYCFQAGRRFILEVFQPLHTLGFSTFRNNRVVYFRTSRESGMLHNERLRRPGDGSMENDEQCVHRCVTDGSRNTKH